MKLTAVAAGGAFMPMGSSHGHSCAVTTLGGVQCWGYNDSGQLGDGSMKSRSAPVAVMGLSPAVKAIAAHGANTCALTVEGGVQCWGSNSNGQLGNDSMADSPVPVAVMGLSGVTAIAVGLQHACAVAGGGVQCWGDNGYGQLGDDSMVASPVPVAVVDLSSDVTAIAAGDFHTCAVTKGGGVQCWGYGGYGQLGNNTTDTVTTPVAPIGLSSGVAAIAAGNEHTCALTTGGAVRCWGYDMDGELGNNDPVNSLVPVAVKGLSSGVAAIAAGGLHTCALTTAGGVQCWGSNTFGQLGNDSTTEMVAPAPVPALSSGVAAIATGEYHTCAVTTSGSVQCWGCNHDGQLGNGYLKNSLVPAHVLEP